METNFENDVDETIIQMDIYGVIGQYYMNRNNFEKFSEFSQNFFEVIKDEEKVDKFLQAEIKQILFIDAKSIHELSENDEKIGKLFSTVGIKMNIETVDIQLEDEELEM